MRRYVVVLLSLLFLIFLVSALASAQQPLQPNWLLYIKTDDGNGQNYFDSAHIGVSSSSTDGYGVDGTASDTYDMRYGSWQSSVKAAIPTFGGKLWGYDLKSRRSPMDPQYDAYGYRKVWFLRVAGEGTASVDTPIRLAMRYVSTAAGLPPLSLPYVENGVTQIRQVKYYLKMTDNKGAAGAPANGTLWEIPMPATFTSTPFFSVTLPTVNISIARNEQSFISDGYQMEFYQQVVTPEPGSLMALACGVMGLGGMFLRRRR